MSKRKSTPTKAANLTSNSTHHKKSTKLHFYKVGEEGIITDPGFHTRKINSDIYDLISVDGLTTPKRIIDEVECYGVLVEHFRRLASDKHDDLIRRIGLHDFRDGKKLQRMKLLAKLLEDEDDGWKKWVKGEGKKGVTRFKKEVVDWLAAPIEWREDMPDEPMPEAVRNTSLSML